MKYWPCLSPILFTRHADFFSRLIFRTAFKASNFFDSLSTDRMFSAFNANIQKSAKAVQDAITSLSLERFFLPHSGPCPLVCLTRKSGRRTVRSPALSPSVSMRASRIRFFKIWNTCASNSCAAIRSSAISSMPSIGVGVGFKGDGRNCDGAPAIASGLLVKGRCRCRLVGVDAYRERVLELFSVRVSSLEARDFTYGLLCFGWREFMYLCVLDQLLPDFFPP